MSELTAGQKRVYARMDRRTLPERPRGKRARHPMPTKEQCWEAFCKARQDAHEPIDEAARQEFERWWRGEDDGVR